MSRRRIMLKGQEDEEMRDWETIIDYTTTEDVTEFFCNTDVDGKPFRLKECMVYLKIMPCEDNEKNEVLININFKEKNAWSNGVACIANAVKNTDKYQKSCIHFKKIDGSFFPVESFRSYNRNSVADQMTSVILSGAYGIFSMDDSFAVKNSTEYIESICIGSYLKVIGKGTHLKVTGIRA